MSLLPTVTLHCASELHAPSVHCPLSNCSIRTDSWRKCSCRSTRQEQIAVRNVWWVSQNVQSGQGCAGKYDRHNIIYVFIYAVYMQTHPRTNVPVPGRWFHNVVLAKALFFAFNLEPLSIKSSTIMSSVLYLLQQMSQLFSASISRADSLLRSDHRTNTSTFRILSWTVHLPSLLRSWRTHLLVRKSEDDTAVITGQSCFWSYHVKYINQCSVLQDRIT